MKSEHPSPEVSAVAHFVRQCLEEGLLEVGPSRMGKSVLEEIEQVSGPGAIIVIDSGRGGSGEKADIR